MTLDELNEYKDDPSEKKCKLIIFKPRDRVTRAIRRPCTKYPLIGCEVKVDFALWCENCLQAWVDGHID